MEDVIVNRVECGCCSKSQTEVKALQALNEVLFAELEGRCDVCHVKDTCEHDNNCNALLDFYKQVAKQEQDLQTKEK